VIDDPLLRVDELVVDFDVSARAFARGRGTLRAVDGVSVVLHRGQTLAIVGESGCGKTTFSRTLLRLYEPTAGRIVFDGEDVTHVTGAALRRLRRRAQMVFQDPYASLNPRMKIGEIIAEPLRAHGIGSSHDRRARVQELLDVVGLMPGAIDQFPHAFSGGQRQRVGIARALALAPELVVADEPVSALDVSIQAQVINLLKRLQRDLGLTLVVIAHDLAVVRQLASRVVVMHLGQIVESGARDSVFGNPSHPYTQALLSAVPVPDPPLERSRKRVVLLGDLPSPIDPPKGCRFHTRCPIAMEVCRTVPPASRPVSALDHDHVAACHAIPPLPDHMPDQGASPL
jgi:oligopeptide transport system ATP-binding protein